MRRDALKACSCVSSFCADFEKEEKIQKKHAFLLIANIAATLLNIC